MWSNFGTLAVKDGTRIAYGHTRDNLEAFFGKDKLLGSIGPSDADKFRADLVAKGLAAATVSRRITIARQMFRKALKWKRITENPFTETKAGSQRNPARLRFIEREVIDKVLKACPSLDWQLVIALARYGGLRVPSELANLQWRDVLWEAKRIIVHSPKTEHHTGHAMRTIPLFDELEPLLLKALTREEPGQHVIADSKLRNLKSNLRSVMHDIIGRAGLTPWPKTFQNLRSTRQTELGDLLPSQVVCAIMGNSEKVAQDHYLQLRDSDLDKAIVASSQAAHKAARKMAKAQGSDRKRAERAAGGNTEKPEKASENAVAAHAGGVWAGESVGAVGFEPTKA